MFDTGYDRHGMQIPGLVHTNPRGAEKQPVREKVENIIGDAAVVNRPSSSEATAKDLHNRPQVSPYRPHGVTPNPAKGGDEKALVSIIPQIARLSRLSKHVDFGIAQGWFP